MGVDLPLRAVAGVRLTLHFSLRLTNGNVIDSTEARGPAELVVGDGRLPPSFEQHLLGLTVGDRVRVEVPAADAFGPQRIENVRRLPRQRFRDMELEPGMMVSFADPGGAELPGVVQELTDEAVMVDFNHPLAGRAIDFEAFIVAIEPPAAETPDAEAADD